MYSTRPTILGEKLLELLKIYLFVCTRCAHCVLVKFYFTITFSSLLVFRHTTHKSGLKNCSNDASQLASTPRKYLSDFYEVNDQVFYLEVPMDFSRRRRADNDKLSARKVLCMHTRENIIRFDGVVAISEKAIRLILPTFGGGIWLTH